MFGLALTPDNPDLEKFAAGFSAKVGSVNTNGGLPGPVMAFGENAAVFAVAKDGKLTRPIVAGAIYGKGRVVVVGHGSILNRANNAVMAREVLRWVNVSGKPIGMFDNPDIDSSIGETKAFRGRGQIRQAVSECGTLILGQAPADGDPATAALLDEYVKKGGGLVLTGPAWGWMQLNPGKTLAKDHSGQLLLSKMGLGFTDGTIDGNRGEIKLLPAEPAHHVGRALAMVMSKRVLTPKESKVAGDSLESALGAMTDDNPLRSRLLGLLNVDQNLVRPTKEKPLTSEQFQLRLAAQNYDKTWRSLPPEQVKAHPASGDFPGPVEPSSRTDVSVTIGGKMRRWWSTGAYAPAGEVVTVRLPETLRNFGLRVRIGGHTDNLWNLEKWERFPSISNDKPIVNGVAKIANPFGGLVYIEANKEIPAGEVEIEHVVEAPVYILGRTSAAKWEKLRKSPAPWGEVVANNCAVSVPTSVLRNLVDPKPVAEYWDEVVAQCELLYSVPAGTREERYQVDRQISAGYMHSGYPIMTWEDVSAKFVDISILRGNDGDKNWGFYHEIGHNFQRPNWTWEGWGETTNNLYSLFGGEHFNHDLSGGHGAMKEDKRLERMKIVKSAPGAEAYFDKDPWYGLTMLRAIREEFGWKPFQTLFAEFRDLPRAEQPKSEDEKHDQFLVRMSRILNRDLGKYLEMWGVKNSAEARAKSKQYPQWLPKSMS